MPFPIDYPSGVGLWPAKVKIRRQRAQAVFENDITLQTKVQLFAAQRYAIDVELQRLARADAATFESWLASLNGMEGSFNFNLDPWVRGSTPGIKIFRLALPDDEWDSELAVTWGYSFSAYQVV